MKKQWSISTTVREAERIRNFLVALQELNGEEWNNDTQKKYQIILIQKRFYGLTGQFFNDLTDSQITLLKSPNNITFEQAKEIFDTKNYEDPPMRGRNSFSPLKKMGLANIINRRIHITSLGEYLLRDDYDLGELFFRFFLKWQLPNPDSRDFKEEDGFYIKPFLGTLHLINRVNHKWESLGKEAKGISKEEFNIFVTSLIHYEKLEEQSQRIIDLRLECENKNPQEQKQIIDDYKLDFAKEFLGNVPEEKINKFIDNCKEYGDNVLRYFRLTRFFYIRGNGYYIDLEPRRSVEIVSLLETDNAAPIIFHNRRDYQSYISDINRPTLPWETRSSLREIAENLISDLRTINEHLNRLGIVSSELEYNDVTIMPEVDLKQYIKELRERRHKLQERILNFEAQHIDKIEFYINQLENIYSLPGKKSIVLEKLTTLALNALNDALEVNPNYPVGDDNEPTFTAPANKADIECFYNEFNAVCEVTMLTNRSQWYNEGQPVMRHVRDFENKYTNKSVYCLFIAPKLHKDTIETFWMSVKYGYRGNTQRIIPMSIKQLINILKLLLNLKKENKQFQHQDLLNLYDNVIELTGSVEHSDEWINQIPNAINAWKEQILNRN
jgi:hypothetical protein